MSVLPRSLKSKFETAFYLAVVPATRHPFVTYTVSVLLIASGSYAKYTSLVSLPSFVISSAIGLGIALAVTYPMAPGRSRESCLIAGLTGLSVALVVIFAGAALLPEIPDTITRDVTYIAAAFYGFSYTGLYILLTTAALIAFGEMETKFGVARSATGGDA